MQETIYFYRDLYSSDFIKTDREKKIIPVWKKNQYNDSNYIYDESEKKWKAAESIPKESDDSILVEFAEFPMRPQKIVSSENIIPSQKQSNDIEDLSPEEMQNFLIFLEKRKRFL